MKKNQISIIIIVIAIVIILGVLFWLGRPKTETPSSQNVSANLSGAVQTPPPPQAPASPLSAAETAFDFGAISMAKGKVSRNFKIQNSSSESVALERLFASCMCTTANLTQKGKKLGPFGMPGHGFVPPVKSVIDPNEEIEIEVVFDPAAHGPAGVGAIERSVYLEGRSGEPLLELKISAMVTP